MGEFTCFKQYNSNHYFQIATFMSFNPQRGDFPLSSIPKGKATNMIRKVALVQALRFQSPKGRLQTLIIEAL